MRQMFDTLNMNGDGKLSREEFDQVNDVCWLNALEYCMRSPLVLYIPP